MILFLRTLRRLFSIGAMLFLFPYVLAAQGWTLGWPRGDILFRPLIAHGAESRIGMRTLRDEHRLRLDIGASADLLEYTADDVTKGRWSAGADFFTWTSLRQAENFHFPVDAVDYLFGININHTRPIDSASALQGRLRFSHISAHLADGSYDKSTGTWRDGRLPRVYSREFLDLVVAYERNGMFRAYIGGQYLVHVDPPVQGVFVPHAGLELFPIHAFAGTATPYLAYDFWLIDLNGYSASHSLQGGVKIGRWGGRALDLFLTWYSGIAQHAEYYDLRWNTWGAGFAVDL